MTLNFKQLVFLSIFFLSTNWSYSQLGFSQEIGAIIGPVTMQSDFGVRNDFETNSGNTGIGIGIVHYINFAYRADCNCYSTDTYFNDHFKWRTELSWNKTTLNHFGKWVDESRTSTDADKLRAHSGLAQNTDFGMQLEFFPKSIRSFQAFSYPFAPFVSLGAHYTWYSPEAYTSYGDQNINNPDNFYSRWEPGSINPDGGSTWSVVGSVGTRYKLTILSDLMIDLRWQYFFSNWVDGLNHQLDSNKADDWLVWLNFGYIYYLD
ncbi:MAG: glutamate dehydrogenase [Bacteroidetes bacterium MedPE-SWsnd-G2]|nr:MAG: glutamate dehydrogenase [Bacteroidetes bacterium MedPE-SWsnd-G2]